MATAQAADPVSGDRAALGFSSQQHAQNALRVATNTFATRAAMIKARNAIGHVEANDHSHVGDKLLHDQVASARERRCGRFGGKEIMNSKHPKHNFFQKLP